jgi:hypothetical protein
MPARRIPLESLVGGCCDIDFDVVMLHSSFSELPFSADLLAEGTVPPVQPASRAHGTHCFCRIGARLGGACRSARESTDDSSSFSAPASR